MLPTTLVHEIDRLLRESHLTQRQIAKQLNVSRGTVWAIASGRRGLYGRETHSDPSPLVPTSPPGRCPSCGYRVYFPCLVCQAREYARRED